MAITHESSFISLNLPYFTQTKIFNKLGQSVSCEYFHGNLFEVHWSRCYVVSIDLNHHPGIIRLITPSKMNECHLKRDNDSKGNESEPTSIFQGIRQFFGEVIRIYVWMPLDRLPKPKKDNRWKCTVKNLGTTQGILAAESTLYFTASNSEMFLLS